MGCDPLRRCHLRYLGENLRAGVPAADYEDALLAKPVRIAVMCGVKLFAPEIRQSWIVGNERC